MITTKTWLASLLVVYIYTVALITKHYLDPAEKGK